MKEQNKFKVLVFDTETTWLFSKKEKDLNKQPYICQFAGILVEIDEIWEYKELKRIDLLIKPPIPMPLVVSEIHWIYDIDLKEAGDFSSYAERISKWINYPDMIVWHNVLFDENILKTEFQRLRMKGVNIWYEPKKVICTMNESIKYCKLPKKSKNSKGYKRPKLQELVKKTCWHFFKGAHNAMVDVEWTLKAFSVLVKNKVIKLEKNNTITLF